MTLDINTYAKLSTIPKYALRFLQREGIIDDPLRGEDQIGLKFLEQIWGKADVLRPQLRHLSMQARLSLIRTADLPTKWERYAYSRFYNLDRGEKLSMQTLIEEIEVTFAFQLNAKQIRRLHKVRNRAQVAKHREEKKKNLR